MCDLPDSAIQPEFGSGHTGEAEQGFRNAVLLQQLQRGDKRVDELKLSTDRQIVYFTGTSKSVNDASLFNVVQYRKLERPET